MKNRKVIVTAFLLVAVMILGIGYAAVSDTLTFSGNATVSEGQVQHEFDMDIKLTAVSEDNVTWIPYNPLKTAEEAEIKRENDLIVAITGSGDDVQDNASFQIFNLTDAGDEEYIWFKVENESAHEATLRLSTVTETGTGDHFTVTYKVYNADATQEVMVLPAKTDAGNGVVLVRVSVVLDTTPSSVYNAQFGFTITAEVA